MSARSNIAGLLFAIVPTLVCLLLAELTLRVALPGPIRWRYPQEHYVFDPETGHRLKENQQAYTHDQKVTTNAIGIRGPDYARKPAVGTRRIIALGDSQTFGNGLAEEDTWPQQLEAKLNKREVEAWEVMNWGVPATDTWQHEVFARRALDGYVADVVTLAFYVNDVVGRPKTIANHIKTNNWKKRIVYIAKQSAVLSFFQQGLTVVVAAFRPSYGVRREAAVLAGEDRFDLDRAWLQVSASLRAIRDRCAKQEVKFFVIVLPRRDQVVQESPATGYNQRLAKILKENGIQFLDMLPVFRERYREGKTDLFIPWDGHHSLLANRIIAQSVAAKLQAGVVP